MVFVLGILTGIVFLSSLAFVMMPRMMMQSYASRFGFDETVKAIEDAIIKAGWSHKGTNYISEELKEHNQAIDSRVAIINLCKAGYAKEVLSEERSRFASALMPCSFSVWEDDHKQIKVTKMNTGLMGKIFGGKIAEIMGGRVGPEETLMLKDIVQ